MSEPDTRWVAVWLVAERRYTHVTERLIWDGALWPTRGLAVQSALSVEPGEGVGVGQVVDGELVSFEPLRGRLTAEDRAKIADRFGWRSL